NISLISLFLKNGADIHKVDELGQNCLFKTYNIDTIRYLIENGANVNQAEIYGTLPVFNVTWNYDLAKLYIESGSDIYHKDMNGRTVLFYALSDDNYKLIQYLIKKDDGIVKDEDNDGYNTLIWYSALGKGDLRVLKLLLECGLEINGQNKKGLNALIVSIINVKFHKKEKYLLSNNIRYIKLLIERGIDVNHKDDYGNTALHCAIRVEREIELLKLLLDNGAKVDIKNKKGETPLDIAIKKGDKVIINLLKSYVKFTRMYNTTGI
ncbi:MAG: ankyrin repeat domain-containing protein, partial [Spirochaetota bacterium]